MKYILTEEYGLLTSCKPQVVRHMLHISFERVPSGAVAVIEADGKKIYRKIEDGGCDIPASALRDLVKVSVVLPDGTASPKRWSCNDILAEVLPDGAILVYPEIFGFAETVSKICIELSAMKRDTDEKLAELKKQIDEYGGYDTF